MLRQKSFVKVTGRGNVTKVVREHYLRDDIPCGYQGCAQCVDLYHPKGDISLTTAASTVSSNDDKANQTINAKSGKDSIVTLLAPSEGISRITPQRHILLVDTNILLHHLDVLETAYFHDVVILQTVLEEVRSNSLPLYRRLRQLIGQPGKRFFVFSNEHHRETFVERQAGETPNDYNDRMIRRATVWYREHLVKSEGQGGVSLATPVLITNDQGNRREAQTKDNLLAYGLRDYCEGLVEIKGTDPTTTNSLGLLLDMLETANQVEESPIEGNNYKEHLSQEQMKTGLTAGHFYKGPLQVSAYNCQQGTVVVSPGGASPPLTIHIKGASHLNRALSGDTVVLELLPHEQWIRRGEEKAEKVQATVEGQEDDSSQKPDELVMLPASEALPQDAPKIESASSSKILDQQKLTDLLPTGQIVGIWKRSVRPICGSILRDSVRDPSGVSTLQAVLVQPLDRRLPRIRLRTRNATTLVSQRLLVSVDGWERSSRYPHGHLVRILGQAGDRATETEVILLENDVAHAAFTPAVLACLPGANWSPAEVDYAERTDFRSLTTICSVDPPGCTDIDDALHAVPLPNGNYQVGVHIADVTHFVTAGAAIDAEASQRSTTVYLVDRRIDMLPELLGTNLCSLRSGVERLAFSCLWELTPMAEIVSTHFCKSIIRSTASFTYDQAQAVLDEVNGRSAEEGNDKASPPKESSPLAISPDLKQSLNVLNKLAKVLKEKRVAGGALTLASPEVRFTLEQETTNPVDVVLKDMKEANSLVEEFMLLANISVARRIYEAFPETAVLRRHPAPPAENFLALSEALATRGFSLDVSSSGALGRSLDNIIVPEDGFFNRLVRIMATRCMYQAQYFAAGSHGYEAFWHYGLAAPIYTHFTSPIRRYADVLVHRLLAAAIDPNRYAGSTIAFDKQNLEEICNNMNYRHRMAQQAQRASVELFTHLFFRDRTITESAYVIKVMSNGIVALIPSYGIEGLIRWTAEELTTAGIAFDSERGQLVQHHKDGSVSPLLSLFQRVTIGVRVEEEATTRRQKLVVHLQEPILEKSLSFSKRPKGEGNAGVAVNK